MDINVCSISFRHELISFRELVRFIRNNGFSGIELWGVHAVSLLRNYPLEAARIVKEMDEEGIVVSMISDYLDFHAPEDRFPVEERKWRNLIATARLFRAGRLRVFAGSKGSCEVTEREWERSIFRLRRIAEHAASRGIYTVIETHPATYADSLDSTLRLLRETDYPTVRINLDFLHLWESGCDPLEAYDALKPWVCNFHFKNVKNRESLQVFEPGNVYNPTGSRSGMAGLTDGAMDYAGIVRKLVTDRSPHPASLEWFGAQPLQHLKSELRWLKETESRVRTEEHVTAH